MNEWDKKEAWILINVGSPDTPAVKDVRRYLRQFLHDPYVIDIPGFLRWLLVSLIIVPFRAPRSARRYRKIWTGDGSPLLQHTKKLSEKVQVLAGDRAVVIPLMRYGNPSLTDWLKTQACEFDQLVFLPLYPQFAGSTTGTVEALIEKEMKGIKNPPVYRLIRQFWKDSGYLEAIHHLVDEYSPREYDHVLFSYHGLPVRQVQKEHPDQPVADCHCAKEMPEFGEMCYRATCYASTVKIAEALSLPTPMFTTTFQSRLSRNWLSPYTDEVLCKLAAEKMRRILLVPMSFVSDNLETLEELNLEYRAKFLECGGGELNIVPCLNDNDRWAEAVRDLFLSESQATEQETG